MEVFKRLDHLVDVDRGFLFCEPSFELKDLEDLATGDEFKDKIDSEIGLEVVVEADDDQSALFNEFAYGPESQLRITGVMEYSIADHQIEAFRPESRPEEVHLEESGAVYPVIRFEAVPQRQ